VDKNSEKVKRRQEPEIEAQKEEAVLFKNKQGL